MRFIGAILAVVLAGQAQASVLVFEDGFSSYGPGDVLNAPDALFNGVWTTTDGTVDYLAPPGGFAGLCGRFGACIDLDGSTNNSGVFSTVQVFAAGNYTIAAEFLGSGRGTTESVRVTLGDFVLIVQDILPNDIGRASARFATTGGPLSFENFGGDNVGALLIGIGLFSVEPAVVPLPASLPLLAGGLGLIAAVRKRRRAA